MQVSSLAFDQGQPIPDQYAKDGENVSPPLAWSDVPDDVAEYALVCDDPDAPREEPWVHWVLYRIPGEVTRLAEGDTQTGMTGLNTWGEQAYGGPQPPSGHGTHHYHFKLYALSQSLPLRPGATKTDLLEAMQGLILDQGELVGTYRVD